MYGVEGLAVLIDFQKVHNSINLICPECLEIPVGLPRSYLFIIVYISMHVQNEGLFLKRAEIVLFIPVDISCLLVCNDHPNKTDVQSRALVIHTDDLKSRFTLSSQVVYQRHKGQSYIKTRKCSFKERSFHYCTVGGIQYSEKLKI